MKKLKNNAAQLRYAQLHGRGWALVPKFIKPEWCEHIIDSFRECQDGALASTPIGLNDSTDSSNTVYQSTRSKLKYCYLSTTPTQEINRYGITRLKALTTMDWEGNINDHLLPLFAYEESGFIVGHRGRDIGFGRNDFVAVCMLTTLGRDFNGGRFYLNEHDDVSEDGKTVHNENVDNRMYFDLLQGELLIFHNNRFVHGTTPVKPRSVSVGEKDRDTLRLTTSWRMQHGK